MTEQEARACIVEWHGKKWPWQRSDVARYEQQKEDYAIATPKGRIMHVKRLVAFLIRYKKRPPIVDDCFNWQTGRIEGND